jgi:hypothetical protein
MYASRAAAPCDPIELAPSCAVQGQQPGRSASPACCAVRGHLPAGARRRPQRRQPAVQPHRRRPAPQEVELLSYEEIGERRFAGWSMGQVNMARLNPALLLKYSATATLDPYAVSGAVSMALFEELVATASIVGQP